MPEPIDWSQGILPGFYQILDRGRLYPAGDWRFEHRVVYIEGAGFRTLGPPGKCVDYNLSYPLKALYPPSFGESSLQEPQAVQAPAMFQPFACPDPNPYTLHVDGGFHSPAPSDWIEE